ncbi:hypothetical protein JY458_20045, partial [Stenotrophomonas maltophilia]|nr:hypothetical protein [Stenotrophomonas maltophilia]
MAVLGGRVIPWCQRAVTGVCAALNPLRGMLREGVLSAGLRPAPAEATATATAAAEAKAGFLWDGGVGPV